MHLGNEQRGLKKESLGEQTLGLNLGQGTQDGTCCLTDGELNQVSGGVALNPGGHQNQLPGAGQEKR